MNEQIVMGIESSCDETACALVNDKGEILSSVVWSQYDEHRRFGGVVPEIAARAHLEKCDVLIKEALDRAGKTFQDLSAVAVAAGPGLIGGVLITTGLGVKYKSSNFEKINGLIVSVLYVLLMLFIGCAKEERNYVLNLIKTKMKKEMN